MASEAQLANSKSKRTIPNNSSPQQQLKNKLLKEHMQA